MAGGPRPAEPAPGLPSDGMGLFVRVAFFLSSFSCFFVFFLVFLHLLSFVFSWGGRGRGQGRGEPIFSCGFFMLSFVGGCREPRVFF